MNNVEPLKALTSFPLFAEVSKRRLRKLARHATRATFAPGETIISDVDYGNHLYVILSGAVEAISRPAARTLRAGDYFGELSLIDGRPRLATVVALTDVELLELPSRSVLKLAREHPAFTLRIFKDLVPRLRQLEAEGAG
jgi:CRP/FNR family transcriptional regulator, cyclic AMP receptor protein